MAREGWKQISVWVPVEILRAFDEWVWEQREPGVKPDRSSAIVRLMGEAPTAYWVKIADPPRMEGVPGARVIFPGENEAIVADLEADAKRAFDAGVAIHSELPDNPHEATMRRIIEKSEGKPGPKVPPVEKPKVIAELAGKLEEIKATCTHPKDRIERFSWGKRCGECGDVLK